jgi:prepilin-type processing-associated H-X9-DG protein
LLTAATFAADIRYARPFSVHPNGFMVALCDGSVHWMDKSVDYGIYAALMTSRGERAFDPAVSPFTNTYPWWQNPRAGSYYPGTKFSE